MSDYLYVPSSTDDHLLVVAIDVAAEYPVQGPLFLERGQKVFFDPSRAIPARSPA